MISWKYSLGEIRRRPGRAALSLSSVIVAVAAIVAVASATATTRLSYQRVFQAMAGRADLEVVARGGGHFDLSAINSIESLPEVQTILPVLRRGTILYAGGQKAKVLATAIQPDEPESISGLTLAAGHWPSAAGEIALESDIAGGLNIKLDDEVKLLTSRGLREEKVCGLVVIDSAIRLHQGGTVLMPLKWLERAFRLNNEVDAVHLFLREPKRPQEVLATIQKSLPAELKAQLPASRNGMAEETMLLTDASLNTTSALSLLTAVIIVLSAFLMNVSERRAQLSVLRCVGATRGQVVAVICREALAMGVAGTIVGLPLGIFGGRFLMRMMASMLQVQLPQSPNVPWALAIGCVAGPVLCLAAAWYPAFKASRVSPLEGMRPLVARPPRKGNRKTTWAGVAGLGISLAMLLLQRELPLWTAVVTEILALISLILLVPVVLGPATRLLAGPLNLLLRLEGEMAERLVLRHGGRSALTVGVLFVAVAAAAGTGNGVFSVTDDVRLWYERTITGDFMMRAMMPDVSGQSATDIPAEIRDEIVKIPGVAQVDTIRVLRVEAAGRDAVLAARMFQEYQRVPLDITAGDTGTMLAALGRGEVVVGSVLAERAGIHVGDTLPISLGSGSHSLRVAGISNEYSFGGSVVYAERQAMQKLFPVEGATSFLIKAEPGQAAAIAPALRSLAEQHGLLLQSFGEVLRLIDGMVASVTGGLWVLLALGLLIGGLGVINTLTMNVLEQTREIGMLRAIGMRRGQVIKVVLGQASLIGLLGIVSGGIAGVSLARLVNLSLGSMYGHSMPFSVRPLFMASLLSAAFAIVLLAALFPARRAAGIRPIEAMRTE